MTPTHAQREAIITKIEAIVSSKFYDPDFNEKSWHTTVENYRPLILEAGTVEEFESAVRAMLTSLSPKISLLSKQTPITPRNAINASFAVADVSGELRWVFQDVLPNGLASKGGVRPGDVLLSVNGKETTPTAPRAPDPQFAMGASMTITVSRGTPAEPHEIVLPSVNPKYKDNPYADLTPLTAGTLKYDIGYLKVSLFPGQIGIDFANQLDSIFQGELAHSKRLIVDLRGNPGGGIGGLALMSYLTPERLPVGYSQNRKMALEGSHTTSLPIFDKVPRSKLAIPGLALKFLGKTSVYLYTEALGKRPHHGSAAILVNEHTTGSAEMVAQFAQENHLATIIGTKTPGRLMSTSGVKLGFGYRLIVPVAAYVSAKGKQIQGAGITPDVPVDWSFAEAMAGGDNQLAAALERMAQANAGEVSP